MRNRRVECALIGVVGVLFGALTPFPAGSQELEIQSPESLPCEDLEYRQNHLRFVFGNSDDVRVGGLVVRRGIKGVLNTPSSLRVGDPWLIRFDVTCQRSEPCSVPEIDISGASPMTTIVGLLAGPFGEEYAFERRVLDDLIALPPELHRGMIQLSSGESVSLWIDLAGLLDSKYTVTRMVEGELVETNRSKILRNLLRPGRWKLVLVFENLVANILPAEFEVLPQPPEKVDFDSTDGDSGPLPMSVHSLLLDSGETLFETKDRGDPTEIESLYRSIAILGAAVQSCDSGAELSWISSEDDLGIYQSLVDEVQFECLLEMGRTMDAESVETRIHKANASLIRSGDGQISRIRAQKEE